MANSSQGGVSLADVPLVTPPAEQGHNLTPDAPCAAAADGDINKSRQRWLCSSPRLRGVYTPFLISFEVLLSILLTEVALELWTATSQRGDASGSSAVLLCCLITFRAHGIAYRRVYNLIQVGWELGINAFGCMMAVGRDITQHILPLCAFKVKNWHKIQLPRI